MSLATFASSGESDFSCCCCVFLCVCFFFITSLHCQSFKVNLVFVHKENVGRFQLVTVWVTIGCGFVCCSVFVCVCVCVFEKVCNYPMLPMSPFPLPPNKGHPQVFKEAATISKSANKMTLVVGVTGSRSVG